MENLVGESGQQSGAGESGSEMGAAIGVCIGDIMAMAEEPSEKGRRLRKASAPHGDVQDRKRQKRRGEIAEAMFLTKAVTMGFSVGTMWGDSDRYDLMVDAGGRLLRVQVKSAHRVSGNPGGGYHVRAHGHVRRPYRASEIDLLVAYVVPEDAWYVFPPCAFWKMKSICLFPRAGKKGSKFEKYRDAWELFEL